MKKFLKKLFFWDSPAQGTFFALTLLGIGPYIIMSILTKYSIVFLLNRTYSLWDDPFAAVAFPIIQIALWVFLIYYMCLTFRFYHRMSFEPGSDIHKYIVRFGLPVLLLIVGWHCFLYDYSSAWIPVWFFGFFFVLLPLLFCGRHWKIAVGSILCWIMWVMMLISFIFSMSEIGKTGKEEKIAVFWSEPFFSTCHRFGFSMSTWIVLWISVMLLLFLAWYLLSARLFAAWEKISLCVLFGKPTTVLWILFVVVSGISYLLVLTTGYELKRKIELAEKRFGHPLTLKALEKVYNGQDHPDRKYWSCVYNLRRKCQIDLPEVPSRVSEPFKYLPETDVVHVRKRLNKIGKDLTQWETFFSDTVPPQERVFVTEELKYSWSCLASYRVYCNLEFWKIQLALADGSIEAALSVWSRMERLHNAMLRECDIDGGYRRLDCGDILLSGVKLLLESGKLSVEDLRHLEGALGKIEKQILSFYERCLYGSLVLFLEHSSNLSYEKVHRSKGETRIEIIPLEVFRFFFPQIWSYWLIYMSDSVAEYTKPDFNFYLLKEQNEKRIIRDCLNSYPQRFSFMFTRFIAELRAIQVLVRAERYRLEHGRYPDRMENLPIDPYNGKPLHYRVGDCRVWNTMVYWHRDPENPAKSFSRKKPDTETVISAVQVWSVGRDQKDDGGLPTGKTDKRNEYSDDIHVIRRLKP